MSKKGFTTFSLGLFITALLSLSAIAQTTTELSPEISENTIATAEPAAPVRVTMATTMGEIRLELYPDKAPITVENFLKYVEQRHYDGLIFHRVINRFMIQTGGFNENMTMIDPEGDTIKNESLNGLENDKGTVAMARRHHPDSAKTQFFINVVDNPALDPQHGAPGYTVFGKVVSGMDVVEKISRLPTQRVGEFSDVPTATVQIIKLRVLNNK